MLKTQFLSYSHQSESILSVDYCILILCILFHVYSFMGIWMWSCHWLASCLQSPPSRVLSGRCSSG